MPSLSFGTWDIILLLLLVGFQIALGIWVSVRQKGADDYFMAGHTLSWWQVGGSVFSTNISATHLIGMLGIGYSVGFAQSHYEILAVFPILLLVFVFVPLYRRLHLFTLSQFLEKRFGERVRLLYAGFMLLLILVQLVGQFYIGARAIALLTQGSDFIISYPGALLLLAGLTCSYSFFGGLKAVVVTDTVQGVFIIFVAFLLCYFALSQPEIGGFVGLLQRDAGQPAEMQRMHLYLPSDHDSLPFTGVFTGLMLLHTFYWVTNQYLVQRVIAARSLRDAQIGALTAGFLKLCIPFTCILTGIAAAHLFHARFDQSTPLPDDAFVYLVHAVVPQGVGWMGIIFAGVAASIFSTLDSMLNSATTLLSIDIYQKYFRNADKEAGETAVDKADNASGETAVDKADNASGEAAGDKAENASGETAGETADNASGETAGDKADDDRLLVRFGRATTLVISLLTAALAYLTYDPSAGGNFFLRVSAYGSYITPGIIAVFFAAVALRGIPGWGAFLAIISAPMSSFAFEWGYEWMGERSNTLHELFGLRLNFLHRVALSFGSSLLLLLWSRRFGQRDGSHQHDTGGMVLARAQWMALVSITAIFVGMNTIAVLLAMFTPLSAPMLALPMGISTALFLERVLAKRRIEPVVRYLSAILVAAVLFILYYFT